MKAKNPYSPKTICRTCFEPIYEKNACRNCNALLQEKTRAFAWNTGYSKGQTDMRNELENDPQSFLQLFEDIVFNEKNLTDEQLKQFHRLCNNQVIYLQKEAHRRGLEL